MTLAPSAPSVVLNAVKDLIASREILRFAQDDTVTPFQNATRPLIWRAASLGSG